MSVAVRKIHTWSRVEYERIVDAGGFAPDSAVELLDGEIIDMSPQKSAHATAIGLIEYALRQCRMDGVHVRAQMPLAIDDRSEPEPDVAVVPGQLRDYASAHPRTALLIVEVADASLAYDRTSKVSAYARNAIADYKETLQSAFPSAMWVAGHLFSCAKMQASAGPFLAEG